MRLLCTLVCATAVWAAGAPGDETTFELTWERGCFSENISRNDLSRTEPFIAEPDTQGRKVYRGIFNVGPDKNEVGFLWDKGHYELYIDMNFDGDLTNDPNGRIAATAKTPDSQSFNSFELEAASETGIYKYQIRAWLYDFGNQRQAAFNIESGYSGTCELNGKKWTFQACDALKGKVDTRDVFQIMSDGKDILNAGIPERIFMDGRCYEMRFEFKKADDGFARLWCTLTEREVPLGKLLVKGESIQQLVLGDGTQQYSGMLLKWDNSEMLVLPAVSEEPVAVPAGDFKVKQIALKLVEDKPVVTALVHKDITIPEGGQAELVIGGPLKSSVDIQRRGNTLTFSYKLVGCGGEEYSSSQVLGYENKPTVTVHKGDTQLAAGTFEFG